MKNRNICAMLALCYTLAGCGAADIPQAGLLNPKETAEPASQVKAVESPTVPMGTPASPEGFIKTSTEKEENEQDINGRLSVHFIDVGQGDCILLEYEEDGDNAYALIDAGDNDKGTAVQKYLMDQGVEKLDYLILTHNHADHIGGADVVISKFDIGHVYMSRDEADSKTYRDVMDALKYRSYKWECPQAGQTMKLGEAQLRIMAAPEGNENLNNDSIVVKATYGESSFLFMGDAEFEEEEELLEQFAELDNTLDVDVLKAGHHGSYTSSSNEFIAEVTPQWTVISCGVGNKYGHPHNTSLYNLADYESGLFRTDVQGTIICTTDGTGYEWNHDITENWKSGEEIAEEEWER